MNFKFIIFRITLSTYKLAKIPIINKLWWYSTNYIRKQKNLKVRSKMHGFNIIQPIDFAYSYNSRLYKYLNAPLIECVFQVFQEKKRKISILDIGAAIGDTVLLLKANCENLIEDFTCIDGDDEFFLYLKDNMKQFSDVTYIKAILSDKIENVGNLVRIHGGTASSQGSNSEIASDLDTLLCKKKSFKVDLIKIDVDGFDGKVINGAKRIIESNHPCLIFEWHPKLIKATGNNPLLPFETLYNLGYRTFVWFTKTGIFNHFTLDVEEECILFWEDICINNIYDEDMHFDIITWHKYSNLSLLSFTNSEFSHNKKSLY